MDAHDLVAREAAHWASVLATLTRRYAWALARLDHDVAARAAAAAAARHAPAAYRRGALAVEQAARLAGAAPAAITTITPPALPDSLRADIVRGWRVAERLPNPEMGRAAAVNRALVNSLSLAWRAGSHDQVIDNPEVVGYRRVADGGACAVCLGLETGDVVADDTPFDAHPNCGCTMEPVTSDMPPPAPSGQDRFDAMTPTQQDALFYGRGGPEMADLVRTGRVRLADLVHRSPRRPRQASVVSQRPLKSFT